jgi:pectate lyase
MTEKGTLMQTGHGPIRAVNLLAAYNAAFDPDIAPDAGWTPTLRTRLDPTLLVPLLVTLFAGAKLPA